MAATVMKVETEAEACCVCGGGGGGELLTPEEHDAAAPPARAPLRTMLLHLNNNKVVPDGRLCGGCAARAADAYEFSAALAAHQPPPLSEKIRALRRRLHQLTQKIDVFIVVGGGGSSGGAGAYSEDDIIMVEKEALAAAAAADDDALEHARNARGDPVYQCSVCPLSFQRVSEYRAHAATHGADARHSCWTCGAQCSTRDQLRQHAAEHAPQDHACHLCHTSYQTVSELRRHVATCPSRCPACSALFDTRADLQAHCAQHHDVSSGSGAGAGAGAGARAGTLVCAVCFRTFAAGAADALSAHALRHRQQRQFVCGYADCVLRFATRDNLMAHIRKCHAAELPPEPAADDTACPVCGRTFASVAAMKRHARVHRAEDPQEEVVEEVELGAEEGDGAEYLYQADGDGEDDGEVEYLEVEALEELDEEDTKPDLALLRA